MPLDCVSLCIKVCPENRWIHVDNNPFPFFHSILSTSKLISADKSAGHLSKAKGIKRIKIRFFLFFSFFFFLVTPATSFQLVWNCCILKCLHSLSVRNGLAQSAAPATSGKWEVRCYLNALLSSTVPVSDWQGRWSGSFTHKHILTCEKWNNCCYLLSYLSDFHFPIKSGWNCQQVWKLLERTLVHTIAM